MSHVLSLFSGRRPFTSLHSRCARRRSRNGGSGFRDGQRFSLEPLEDRVLLAVDLALAKDDGDIRTAPGETVPYTLTYSNRGDDASHGARIFERVPEFTRFNEAESTDGWACHESTLAGTVCTFDVGPLEAGHTDSVVFAVTVSEHVPARVHEIHNFAHIRGSRDDGHDPHPRNNIASDSTPIVHEEVRRPDLVLEKSDGDAQAAPGDTIVYKLGYGNVGTAAATGVVLTDRLPRFTTFDAESSSDGWRCNDERICQLEVGELPAEQRGMVTFAVTVNEELPSRLRSITNVARIADDGSQGRDPTPRNNFAVERTPIVNPNPDLRLRKSDGLRWATAGDTLSYNLVYANSGGAAATGVVLTERIPRHTTFDASASSDGWRCADDGLCQLEIGELPAGERAEKTFAVTVDEDLPRRFVVIVNIARIHDDGSSGRDPTPWNNRAFDVTFVTAGPTPEPGGDRAVDGASHTGTLRLAPVADGFSQVEVNRRALAAVSAELFAGGRIHGPHNRLAGDIARRLPSRDHAPAVFDTVAMDDQGLDPGLF